jgi:hypothetical protein
MNNDFIQTSFIIYGFIYPITSITKYVITSKLKNTVNINPFYMLILHYSINKLYFKAY